MEHRLSRVKQLQESPMLDQHRLPLPPPSPEWALHNVRLGGFGSGSGEGGEEAEAVEQEEQAARDGRRRASVELVPHHGKFRVVRIRRVLRRGEGGAKGADESEVL